MEAKQPGAPGGGPGVGGMGNEVPQVPSWFIFIRYAQIVMTFVVFICSCVALSQVKGYIIGWGAGFSLFTSIYTAIFLAGVMLVPKFAPQYYFKWFCLGGEAFAVLWWLISFAGLATWADLLSVFGDLPSEYAGPLKTAYGACAAGAAFGAFNWVAFCVTLVFYSIGCHRHRVGKMGWNAGGVEAGGASMGPIGVQHTGATAQPVYDTAPTPVGYGYQGEPQQYPTVPTPAPSQGYHQ